NRPASAPTSLNSADSGSRLVSPMSHYLNRVSTCHGFDRRATTRDVADRVAPRALRATSSGPLGMASPACALLPRTPCEAVTRAPLTVQLRLRVFRSAAALVGNCGLDFGLPRRASPKSGIRARL